MGTACRTADAMMRSLAGAMILVITVAGVPAGVQGANDSTRVATPTRSAAPHPSAAGASAREGKGGVGLDPLQRVYRHNRAGNEAFSSGDIEQALREYAAAQNLAPGDARLLYNLGNTLARQQKPEEAEKTLERAAATARDPELARDAVYNRGLVQMEQQDLAAAAQSFARALTIDPSDEQARHNLELALRQLQQQQQQQQQQQEGQEQQQEGQQQQQQGQQEQQQGEQQQQQGQQTADERKQNATESPQQSAQQQAARRLLQALENAEKDALRKALRQQIPNLPDRKEDW